MLFQKPRHRLAWTLVLLPLLAMAGDEVPLSGQPITLAQAVARSQASNPDLAVAGYALRVQDGLSLQAGLAPNPELGITVEDALGTGDRSGFSSAQTTLSLRQIIERGAATRRVAASQAGRDLLDAERVEQQLDIAAETARRYLRVLSDQLRLDLAGEGLRLAEAAVTAAKERVDAARAPDAEFSRAQVDLARAELDREDIEHELLTSRRQLAALWGDADASFGIAAGNLTRLPDLKPFEALAGQLKANPSLLKFGSETRLREAELRLAEQRRKPAWEVSAGIRRYEAGNDVAGVFGLSIPLPWRDQGQGTIAAAQARVEQVDASRTASELRMRTHLFELFQELQHARHVADTLDRRMLPRATESLKQTEYAYARGRYSYLELVAAQRDLLATKRARIQAAVDAHGYATEIDRLTGTVPNLAPGSAESQ